MEENDEQKPQEQHKKQYDWLKGYQFVKGQSGNPGGRPKGVKSLKQFAKEYLEELPDDQKVEYLKTLPTEIVWKMAEGNPKNDLDLNARVSMANVLSEIENGNNQQDGTSGVLNEQSAIEAVGQTMADLPALQDSGQEQKPDNLPAEQSASPLPSPQVVQEHYIEEQATGIHD